MNSTVHPSSSEGFKVTPKEGTLTRYSRLQKVGMCAWDGTCWLSLWSRPWVEDGHVSTFRLLPQKGAPEEGTIIRYVGLGSDTWHPMLLAIWSIKFG